MSMKDGLWVEDGPNHWICFNFILRTKLPKYRYCQKSTYHKVGSGQQIMRLTILKRQIITAISTRISYPRNLVLSVALQLSAEGNSPGNAS